MSTEEQVKEEPKLYVVESVPGRLPWQLLTTDQAAELGLDISNAPDLETWLANSNGYRVPNDELQQTWGLPIDNPVDNIDLVVRVQHQYLPVLTVLVESLKEAQVWYEPSKPETKQFAISSLYMIDGEINVRFHGLESKEHYLTASSCVYGAETIMDLFT